MEEVFFKYYHQNVLKAAIFFYIYNESHDYLCVNGECFSILQLIFFVFFPAYNFNIFVLIAFFLARLPLLPPVCPHYLITYRWTLVWTLNK